MPMFKYSVYFLLLFPAYNFAQNVPLLNKSQQATSLRDNLNWENLVYAGNLGLNFGNVTSISFSPMIGYKVTPKFIPGIGLTYNYIKFNYPNFQSESIHIYGGSIWARYYAFTNVFGHGEYEMLNGKWNPYFRPGYRYYLNSLLIGAGYQENLGRISSYILVLYNVTKDEDSPYTSPLIIRVGLAFGM